MSCRRRDRPMPTRAVEPAVIIPQGGKEAQPGQKTARASRKVRTLAEAEAAIGAAATSSGSTRRSSTSTARSPSSPPAGVDGSFAHWGVIDNTHVNHILDLSVAPADVPPTVAKRGDRDRPRHPRTARRRRRALRRVLPDEIRQAPRQRARPPPAQLRPPHDRRQRHQPVRATAPRRLRPAARLHAPAPPPPRWLSSWATCGRSGEPNWAAACAVPDVKLHLYGKADPRPGRKMGHLTALADTPAEAARLANEARATRRVECGTVGFDCGCETRAILWTCRSELAAKKKPPRPFDLGGFCLMLAVTYFPAEAVSSAPQA